MPTDAEPAQRELLAMAASASPLVIIAYSFSWQPLIQALLLRPGCGKATNIAIDASQASTHVEQADARELIAAGIPVTLTDSPRRRKAICHAKIMALANGEIWEGSTNFSKSAWIEANVSTRFRSPVVADEVRKYYNVLCARAWARQRELQIMPCRPMPVTTPWI